MLNRNIYILVFRKELRERIEEFTRKEADYLN